MSLKQITFKHPVKVFQVFRNINVYGKANKSFDNRREKTEWKPISSKAGYVKDGELYLPESILGNPDFKTCDVITFEDNAEIKPVTALDMAYARYYNLDIKPVYNHCFHLDRVNKLDIFEIRKTDEIELHLLYGYFEIGTPKRGNIKLCEIRKGEPVEVKINGKTDFSMSSRRARVFKEQAYIFEYIGDFTQCMILKEPYEPVVKHVPEKRKLVDMMKTLW